MPYANEGRIFKKNMMVSILPTCTLHFHKDNLLTGCENVICFNSMLASSQWQTLSRHLSAENNMPIYSPTIQNNK